MAVESTSPRYPLAVPDLRGNEEKYVRRAVRDASISGVGREVRAFEESFGEVLGVRHCVAVSSGTAALHLALEALDLRPGDEVLVPDLTYVAAANVVRYTGAEPVLVDVDEETWTLSPAAAEAACNKRTRAILAVHLYGNPADLGRLRALARARKIALIEDAAEAFGATWKGGLVGGFGDFGCFSFFGNKVVTTGEGGLVTARRASAAATMRALRDQAKSGREAYRHERLAFNYRLSALQAAVGLAQLERVAFFLKRRDAIRRWYRDALRDLEGWREPKPPPGAASVNWLYSGRVVGWSRRRRDRCLGRMNDAGVDARPLFLPMSEQAEFRASGGETARRVASSGLSLPTHTQMKKADVDAIAAVLRSAARD